MVIDLYRGKVPHFVLREADLDTVVDTGHRADKNGDFLLAPEVAISSGVSGVTARSRARLSNVDLPAPWRMKPAGLAAAISPGA